MLCRVLGNKGSKSRKGLAILAVIHVSVIIYIVLFDSLFASIQRSRWTTKRTSLLANDSIVPDWLLYRTIRSAILLAEKRFGRDLDVVENGRNYNVLHKRCRTAFENHDEVCNLTLSLALRDHDPSSALEEFTFNDATRPQADDEHTCNIKLVQSNDFGETQQENKNRFIGLIDIVVECHNIRLFESSRILVFAWVEFSHLSDFISSWIGEADSSTSASPLHVVLYASAKTLSIATDIIQNHVNKGSICVSTSSMLTENDPAKASSFVLYCPNSGKVKKPPSIRFIMIENADQACRQNFQNKTKVAHTDENSGVIVENCLLSSAMRASRHAASVNNLDYVLMQGHQTLICKGSIMKLFQAVTSLRRAFSLIRCGPGTSCLLFNARDMHFWAVQLEGSKAKAEETLFHHGHGLSTAGQQRFQDADILVSRETLVYAAPDAKERADLKCGTAMTKEALPELAHEQETYLAGSGCVPTIDLLSPCLDKRKTIHFLSRPQWFAPPAPPPAHAMSVQVLTKDRPGVLFRTVSKLLEQTRGECITIHVDGVADHDLNRDQAGTLKLVRWLSGMYGVRWRRQSEGFSAALARRMGFRRNYDDMEHGRQASSSTDRLVHMTWSALAYAFELAPSSSLCSSNATLILEDDLLPAPDLMDYLTFGLSIMEGDPKVKVVSAWNDNSFNIRPGLDCAVQRGEYFMGLGWLTTRSVYLDIVSHMHRWPVKTIGSADSLSGEASLLSITGGWETPLLNLFDEEGVGLFPTMNRVMHQPSSHGWSTSSLLQTQLLDAAVIKPAGPPCVFRNVSESRYESDMRASIIKGIWVDWQSTKCYKDLLQVQESTTFVVGLWETHYSWSEEFAKYLLPFSWIRGFSKTRGAYKDTVLIHAAHHLLILIGPGSFLRTDPAVSDRFRKLALSPEQASQLFNETCAPVLIEHDPPQGAAASPLLAVDWRFVSLHLARPGEHCESFCLSVGRVCREWAGVFTSVGMDLRHRHHAPGREGTRLHVRRAVSAEAEPFMVPYGHVIPHDAWGDLPALRSGAIELGLPRLFRCNVTARDVHTRRLCPCLDPAFAERQGARGLFE